MVAYRIFCMDGMGHIHFAEPLEAEDDEDAVENARNLKPRAIKCEVWHLDILVATLKPTDASA